MGWWRRSLVLFCYISIYLYLSLSVYLYTCISILNLKLGITSGGFRGGQGAMVLGLALFMPKKGLALLPPPPPTHPPQCICQNVQKYSVRCLKVVPGVPKMILIRSKSKKYPPISSKAACKICPKVIPDHACFNSIIFANLVYACVNSKITSSLLFLKS